MTISTRHGLLAIALAGVLATGACAREDATDMAAPADDAAIADTDAMATDGMAGDPAAMPADAGPGGLDPGKDLVANASASPDHTTLVSAVQAADLVATLQGPGPYTVFAPTDAAFQALPAGTVEGLLQPDQKEALAGILTYHVVPGSVDAAALASQIEAGGGTATLATVNGAELTAALEGDAVVITDAKGGKARVSTADLRASNGVIHVVDAVLMP